MGFFSKKENGKNKIPFSKPKIINFDITNKPESNYYRSSKYITLKPMSAFYYDNDENLVSFVLPRFFRFEYSSKNGGHAPVEQATCIAETGDNKKELRKEPWFHKTIFLVKEEVQKYSTKNDFELTLRRYGKTESDNFEKIEMKDRDFGYSWFYDDTENYTCAKIFDFYTNMDKEIIKAFGNGLFESLKTFMELHSEMSVSSECNAEIANYINQIYDTAISMGETIEEFPTVLDYINIKNEADMKKKEEELEKKRQLKEKQNQFIRDLKIKQSLLDDFNRPFTKEEKA